MTDANKYKIAASFPGMFEPANLGVEISSAELKIFEDGIWAKSMDEKWNVFVLEDTIYFARSWTGHCIFKVFVKREQSAIVLK